MALQKYNQKRNFKVTPEPRGKLARSKSGQRFYVQKHDASHLHFDFRLEHDGVLKSWAVPKGPSVKPGVRRLAMEVEDHPLEYGHFEGTIPKGEYGGGTVMLWDRGRWLPDGEPGEQFKQGKITFKLKGRRLSGTWSLVRTKTDERGKKMWFLIKKNVAGEETSSEPVDESTTSVATDRSMEEIALSSKTWHSNRVGGKSRPALKKARVKSSVILNDPGAAVKPARLPDDFVPEMATLVDAPPTGDQWCHEVKFDGYRLIAHFEKGRVSLFSRNGLDWTERLSAVAERLEKLKLKDGILDGELVAPDERGYADFQELQQALKEGRQDRLVYYAFDLVRQDKKDLRALPFIERKARLQKLFASAQFKRGPIRLSEHAVGQGEALFSHACRLGLEGIISKKAQSKYEGRRTRDWLKVKCQLRQEFVVVGFSDPTGAREKFGALLLAAHDGEGRLRYVGRTGTGFNQALLTSLKEKLDRLHLKKEPKIYDPGGDLSKTRDVTWVKPKLVVEVKFASWTKLKMLRQAVYQGLREDKAAKDVKLELAKPLEAVVATRDGGASAPVTARGSRRKSRNAQDLEITRADKVLFSPDITKADLLHFYERIEKWIMPYLKNRPLAVVRCPDGHAGTCFFQKHETAKSIGKEKQSFIRNGKTNEFIYVESFRGLAALVQLGVLEIHAWGASVAQFEKPDCLVFDLDADVGVAWSRIVEAALKIRQRLKRLKLQSFVKTTGGKGLHVVVPFTPGPDWNEVKNFSKAFAEALAAEFPDEYTANMSKAKRKGKIFIDYLRNGRGATAVLPYSTRAKARAPVATPLTWRELPEVRSADQYNLRNFEMRLKRLKKDPWKNFFDVKQSLPKLK